MHGPRNCPDLVVVRPGPGLPAGVLPRHLDGRWFDLTRVPLADAAGGHQHSALTAVPSGRFEVRDDGAVAEVYEVHPADTE